MKNSITSFLLFCLIITAHNVFAQTSNPDKYKYDFVVAKDGSGDYKYIQDAIDAMRVFPLKPITLYIKNGVYIEKIELPRFNVDVSFIGEDVDKTIITFNDYAGRGKHIGTFNSYTAKISGNRFKAENITFENSAGTIGQAVALHVDADKALFKNCKFIGNQDTIYHGGEYSRQLFEDCYIEGTTDFIFGPATAVFKNCTIHCKSDSYITAPNTPKDKAYGFVFLDCKITTSKNVTKLYLGRPWRYYAKSVFVRCKLPEAIRPEGWHNWGNPENEKTAFFAEYQCYGAGGNAKNRVSWSHQLDEKEASNYTVKTIFNTCNPWEFE
ncbi:pectinesterase family protein [Aestuariibaculum sediminum]|uniref:Pectinesterase n=1 Tax=Aestuariibaculum sediminum TaxID=2770637 RepID=A0A8J6Q9E2_9FLAO|nr:pectinesterase family protein [Aestuariibaculum sediminum]MBD0830841.1 pectinesterase [Aestuariibaculum sediminum]